MNFLPVVDQQSAAEASPLWEEVSDVQIEHRSDFRYDRKETQLDKMMKKIMGGGFDLECETLNRIRPNKTVLVVVLNENYCTRAMKAAILYFQEIHIILPRAVIEDVNTDKYYYLRCWMEAVTSDGKLPFTSVELVGKVQGCALGRLNITFFVRSLFT